MRPPVPQPSRVTPMAVPAQIGADFSCSGCNSARSANGRTTMRAYVSYPSKIHPRKLAPSMRQCVGVRSAYQACDADRTEATEFINFLLPQAASRKKRLASPYARMWQPCDDGADQNLRDHAADQLSQARDKRQNLISCFDAWSSPAPRPAFPVPTYRW